ncbi:NAD-dependent epimerase/dehydratase family protein [Kribbella antibiotica]|uniref:NAD-dependent epimerase/dehydratase family protein n=1 Tax=Kribbella antibiotica TaxID=190195 RepID=A0A4R4ZS48_9ACTN|nr:NAD(P)H-binding protein [Kribbella antibiotica]TDD61200.1 NAD-dependent epimerase/dehydratase family protein [Kribbella antibiotica]
MRILVFGATGAVGSRVTQEARNRGHQVTAVSRTGTPRGDASDSGDVAELSQGHDVVISATRPQAGQESELVLAAMGLLNGLRFSGIRLILVGGAASLTVPGTGRTLVEQPGFPDEYRPIAVACNEQFDLVKASNDVDWTYVSPPDLLEPGVRTGTYRLGTDELVVTTDGTSSISMEDFAMALVDEAERAKHHGRRFTVGY